MENIDAKYKETLEGFKKQIEEFIKKLNNGMAELQTGAASSSKSLKEDHLKAYNDLTVQLKKAMDDVLVAYTKNNEDLKKQVKDNYENISGQAKTTVESNLSKFKEQTQTLLKNVPTLSDKPFNELVASIEQMEKKTLAEMLAKYNQIIANLDKSYAEALGQLKSPAVSAGGSGSGTSGAGTSGASKNTQKPKESEKKKW